MRDDRKKGAKAREQEDACGRGRQGSKDERDNGGKTRPTPEEAKAEEEAVAEVGGAGGL